MASKVAKMTNKQRIFCSEYIKDLNGTQAAIRAGVKISNANSQAGRWLVNASIQAYIQQLIKDRESASGVTAAYVVTSLKKVADRCMQEEAVYDHEGNKTGEYKFDSSGACKALDLLGRHLGIFEEDNKQKKADMAGFADMIKRAVNG